MSRELFIAISTAIVFFTCGLLLGLMSAGNEKTCTIDVRVPMPRQHGEFIRCTDGTNVLLYGVKIEDVERERNFETRR